MEVGRRVWADRSLEQTAIVLPGRLRGEVLARHADRSFGARRRSGSVARSEAASADAGVRQRAEAGTRAGEVAEGTNSAPPAPLGSIGAPKARKRLDQAGPPRAPAIGCKRIRGSSGDEMSHGSLLQARLVSRVRPDGPAILEAGSWAANRHTSVSVWSRAGEGALGEDLSGPRNFFEDSPEISLRFAECANTHSSPAAAGLQSAVIRQGERPPDMRGND